MPSVVKENHLLSVENLNIAYAGRVAVKAAALRLKGGVL